MKDKPYPPSSRYSNLPNVKVINKKSRNKGTTTRTKGVWLKDPASGVIIGGEQTKWINPDTTARNLNLQLGGLPIGPETTLGGGVARFNVKGEGMPSETLYSGGINVNTKIGDWYVSGEAGAYQRPENPSLGKTIGVRATRRFNKGGTVKKKRRKTRKK
tara:strand:- start:287 stop:763 length:477 start_codon:yes stop_codon:yes gene_type:complete